METVSRYAYSVYADCGVGEFLWRKTTGSAAPGLVGDNLYSLMDVGHVPEEMSQSLFKDFCDWARFYMAQDNDWPANTREIDWDQFNQRGLELAQQLKDELGCAADVQYVYAWDDPKRYGPPVVMHCAACDK